MTNDRALHRRLAVALLLFSFAVAGPAEEEEKPWSGEGRVGFVSTSGNTDIETLNVGLDVNRKSERWWHSITFAAVSASDTGTTTAERYELNGTTRYLIDEKGYWFGSLRHQDDRFSGFEYQSSLAGGYGRIFIENEVALLSAEAGVGYRRAKPVDGMGTSENAIFQSSVKFERQIGETSKFANNFIVEAGDDNTFVQNIAEVQVKMTEKLSLAVGYEVRHNTDVAPEIDKTDTLTTVNLVFGF